MGKWLERRREHEKKRRMAGSETPKTPKIPEPPILGVLSVRSGRESVNFSPRSTTTRWRHSRSAPWTAPLRSRAAGASPAPHETLRPAHEPERRTNRARPDAGSTERAEPRHG